MQAYNYNLQYARKEGYDLLAPDTYWNSTEEEILAVTGGCGPGRIGDWFVPDTIWGESIFLACQIHDWMYHIGETAQDKRVADKVFMWNMLEIVDDGEILDAARLRRVMTYYQAVSFGGGDCFDKGGENANSKISPCPKCGGVMVASSSPLVDEAFNEGGHYTCSSCKYWCYDNSNKYS